ncbi:hypothetical protein [Streptomyces yunnanensis]|uniref:Uncharacterized protein n=1 Tax=Streptomyces yunnanensis TaxID=156453 RepID=A0A9X8N992_9ACTN|nr:hypothetical protein [Streptomyces yunnanensis]SHN32360.1 hypothetical protein SAMN05216268_13610 [Streptomyces yunnanensis]
MGDFLIRSTDLAIVSFTPPALVIAPPGIMKGSAATCTVVGLPVCLVNKDDQPPLFLTGLFPYTKPPYVIPGMGRISLQIDEANKSKKATYTGAKAIVKGKKFTAKFTVTVPAQQPSTPSPTPDPKTQYTGQAVFVTSNTRATSG